MSGSLSASRRRLSAEERRRRVLDAAARQFGEKGYQQASLREIATAAGVTTPVLYDHFGSKAELYVAVAWEAADSLLEYWSSPIKGTPEEIFRVTVDRIFAWVEAHPDGARIMFAELPSDELVARNIGAVLGRARGAVAALFAANEAAPLPNGLTREQASEALAELAMSAVNGLAAWWWLNPELPRGVVVSLACDVLWGGLGRLSATDGEDGGPGRPGRPGDE